jgi:hypothetical protein
LSIICGQPAERIQDWLNQPPITVPILIDQLRVMLAGVMLLTDGMAAINEVTAGTRATNAPYTPEADA